MPNVKKLGLISCTAIVAGNMMGSGIALLPSSLAHIGSVTMVSWIFAIIGALCLAFVYARLGTLNPQAGGPVAYAEEVSPILGFQAGSLYFHSNWVGNSGIAIAAVAYLSTFWPLLHHTLDAAIAAIVVIWTFMLINCFGAAWIARLTVIGVILLLIPIGITAFGGWFFFHPDLFVRNWNVAHQNNLHSVIAGVLLCLWSFIGLESASTDSGLTENPKKTIPRSTMLGVSVAALVYFLSSASMFGLFSAQQLMNSGSPFAISTAAIIGQWALPWASGFIGFACLTSLGSWMMLVSEAAARSANDGILPHFFAYKTPKGVPLRVLLLTSTLMSLLVLVVSLFSKSSSEVFSHIISIAVLLVILPYFYSVLNFIHVVELKGRQYWQLFAAILAAVFCFAAIVGAADMILVAALIVSLCTLIFYQCKDRTEFEANVNSARKAAEVDEGIG